METNDDLLERLQSAAFSYIRQRFNPANGLIADTNRAGAPASISAVGFALASYPVAVERGWMTRNEALNRALITLRFFWNSRQSEAADATGHKGFYFHFLDMKTGSRVWQSELSPVDTVFLIAGMLTVGMYFNGASPEEIEVRHLADSIYRRVDWAWMQNGAATVWQGWRPESGYLHYGWEGYSEAILLYVLGAASPTHPLSRSSFEFWTSTYQWENLYGYDLLYAGPLFIHQYSHAWLDLRFVRDRFMREKESDYFENSRHAIHVQRHYAQRNPHGFEGYDENCWALSAGEGPGPLQLDHGNRRFFSYAARGVPFGPDDGTLSPPALVASLPFEPQLTITAIRHLSQRYPMVFDECGIRNGFNPTMNWLSEAILGLDQGIVVLMIENHRSQLIWNLMQRCPYISRGLRRIGFKGGWL